MPSFFTFAIAAVVSLIWNSAVAQDATQFIDAFQGMMRSTIRQATLAEWRRLSAAEGRCIDENLRQRGQSVRALIQRGITPSDPYLTIIRCDAEVT